MKYITLGKTDLTVSRVAFGTWQLGGDWGSTDVDGAAKAIRTAADNGVTFFDTAQAYGFGASEALLAKGLHGLRREDLVIATKGGLRKEGNGVARDSSAASITEGVESSLRSLDTDYIDLYQVHWPDPNTPFEETADALAKLIAAGQDPSRRRLQFQCCARWTSSAQACPSKPCSLPITCCTATSRRRSFPYTSAHDIGVLVYGPLAHGMLGGGLRPGHHIRSR